MIFDFKLYEKIEKYTCTTYDGVRINELEMLITNDAVKTMIEDLVLEIDRLNEHIEDIIQDRNDNWKPISIEEQVE